MVVFTIYSCICRVLKTINPLSAQEQHKEDRRTDAPGQRICPEYHPDIRNEMHRDGNVGDTENAPDTEHDHHRDRRFSGTAQDRGNTVGKCQQDVEQRDAARLC